ncbi:hypothetical protein [Streptomyces sp. NPDC089799]|uniref:hypothetical protein n=1 Tax=Streptomyces sp. NPDC089799 TaxID=3155066 RepID=UPI00342590CF
MSNSSMRKTTLGAVGLAVVGTLVLTGCKDGNEELISDQPTAASPSAPASQPSEPMQSGSPSAPASPSTPDAGAAPGGGPAGAAKDGQQFKLGEPAAFPFKYGSTQGDIALTVTKIVPGQPADLDVLKMGDKVKGKVPYYIHYTVKNIGSGDLAYSSVGHIRGLLGDGTDAQDLMIIGKFAKCDNESLPKGFTKGKTQDSCAIALAPSAETKVTAARYWGDPFLMGKGLTWK